MIWVNGSWLGQWALPGWFSRPRLKLWLSHDIPELLQASLIQWVDKGPILWGWWKFSHVWDTLPDPWSGLWLCVFYSEYMTCWSQPAFLGVKQYAKESENTIPLTHLSAWISRIPESIPGFPFSVHQLFSGVRRRCLACVLTYPTVSATCHLPFCCSAPVPGRGQWLLRDPLLLKLQYCAANSMALRVPWEMLLVAITLSWQLLSFHGKFMLLWG